MWCLSQVMGPHANTHHPVLKENVPAGEITQEGTQPVPQRFDYLLPKWRMISNYSPEEHTEEPL